MKNVQLSALDHENDTDDLIETSEAGMKPVPVPEQEPEDEE